MSKQQKGNYAELVKWDNQNYTATSTLSYNNNSSEDMKRRIMLKWNESKLWQIQHRKNKLFLVFAKRFSASVFSWCESCCERVYVCFFPLHILYSFICLFANGAIRNVEQIIDFTLLGSLNYSKWKRVLNENEIETQRNRTRVNQKQQPYPKGISHALKKKTNAGVGNVLIKPWFLCFCCVAWYMVRIRYKRATQTAGYSNAWQSLPFVRSMT